MLTSVALMCKRQSAVECEVRVYEITPWALTKLWYTYPNSMVNELYSLLNARTNLSSARYVQPG